MKIVKLINDFRPQRKCGAEIIGASILGGAGIFGSLMQSDINDDNLAYGAWQSEEQRNWATNERFASQMFNRNERLQTQEWNKPTHMAQMYRAAGLNPSVNSSTMASAASSPMSSSPVGASAAAPGNSVVPNIPQLISSGADLVQALAKNTETKANLPLVNQQVEYLLQKTYGEEKANELKDLSIAFEKSSMPAKVKQEFEKLSSLIIQNGVAVKQGKVFDADVALKKSQERLNDMMKNLHGEELVKAQFFNGRLQDIYNADMSLKGAQTREANAKAVEAGENANQTRIFNKIYGDKRYQHSLISSAVSESQKLISDGKISKSQAEQMKYLVEQAAYANDMKEFTYWSGQVNQFVNTLGSAASQFYGAGALRELINLRKGQAAPHLMNGNDYYMEGGLLFKR